MVIMEKQLKQCSDEAFNASSHRFIASSHLLPSFGIEPGHLQKFILQAIVQSKVISK
jgi:hypothetical protein